MLLLCLRGAPDQKCSGWVWPSKIELLRTDIYRALQDKPLIFSNLLRDEAKTLQTSIECLCVSWTGIIIGPVVQMCLPKPIRCRHSRFSKWRIVIRGLDAVPLACDAPGVPSVFVWQFVMFWAVNDPASPPEWCGIKVFHFCGMSFHWFSLDRINRQEFWSSNYILWNNDEIDKWHRKWLSCLSWNCLTNF